MKATWNGVVLAESDDTIIVEGNHYFPLEAVNHDFFVESDTHTRCPWKGLAGYYTIEVEGQRNPQAAWYTRTPAQPPGKSRTTWRSGRGFKW